MSASTARHSRTSENGEHGATHDTRGNSRGRRGGRGPLGRVTRVLVALGLAAALVPAGLTGAWAKEGAAAPAAPPKTTAEALQTPGTATAKTYPKGMTALQALKAERKRLGIRASAVEPRIVCYRAYVQGLGWLGAICDGYPVGSVGLKRAIESLQIAIGGTKGFCTNAYLLGRWQTEHCHLTDTPGSVTLGTIGHPMEAVFLRVGSGPLSARAHVAGLGDMPILYGTHLIIGTTGQNRRLEAIWIAV
ncbi:hypothetical protein JNUCC64_10885 [Streptomyces sp. JNUCC 64]